MIVTDENFDSVVSSHKTILIDFWAPWCGPCKKVSPILDEISSERGLWVGKLNVDENPIKSAEYSITSIPYMVLFRSGKPVKTITGAKPKHIMLEELSEWISE
jgi:thioredoxin 1